MALLVVLLVIPMVMAADYKYVPPKPDNNTNPDHDNEDMAIQGFIFCKSAYSTYPIQGAKVKVVCPIVDSVGKLIAKVTITSYPTDSKGYFYLFTRGLSHKVNHINACKVKLDSSPVSTCTTPTNVNKGVTGAPLYNRDNFNLYTLEPFYFSTSCPP